MSLKSSLGSALAVVRRFQSETDAIRETPDPISARLTIFVLTGFIVAVVIFLCFARLDRVVTSSAGKVVTKTELLSVFQALDPSLIKSIDVREGDQVETGQLLATLDQTFAEADAKQLKLQIASLEAQTARDEAELAGKPLVFPEQQIPICSNIKLCKRIITTSTSPNTKPNSIALMPRLSCSAPPFRSSKQTKSPIISAAKSLARSSPCDRSSNRRGLARYSICWHRKTTALSSLGKSRIRAIASLRPSSPLSPPSLIVKPSFSNGRRNSVRSLSRRAVISTAPTRNTTRRESTRILSGSLRPNLPSS